MVLVDDVVGACNVLLWMDIMTWNILRRYSVDKAFVVFSFMVCHWRYLHYNLHL